MGILTAKHRAHTCDPYTSIIEHMGGGGRNRKRKKDDEEKETEVTRKQQRKLVKKLNQ